MTVSNISEIFIKNFKKLFFQNYLKILFFKKKNHLCSYDFVKKLFLYFLNIKGYLLLN